MRLLLAALGLAGLALQAQPAAPDLLTVHARVFTGVSTQPWAASVLTIVGGRIVHEAK